MEAETLRSDLATPRRGVPRDERVFFELVGPAIQNEPLVFLCENREYRFGSAAEPTVVRVHEPEVFARMLAEGNLGLAEAYMDKKIEVVRGTLENFIMSLARADVEQFIRADPRSMLKLAGVYLRNLLRGRYRNVQSHYDTGVDLFEAFLDDSMGYSCGYQVSATDTLRELQFNKYDRICQKLRIKPGDRLLDIGCGFAGLLIHAAKHHGALGTGITIANDHFRRGSENVAAAGLGNQVQVVFASHKDLPGSYDKVVSVGMFEHLMVGDYPSFFGNIKRSLSKDGLGLLHTVGCNTRHNSHDPFIQKYMLPATRTPKLSELAHHLEQNDLPIQDVENMVRHYAPTLRGWYANFQKSYPKLDHKKYDERCKRMFDYYFNCGVAAALTSTAAVYQVLFANNHKLEMPLQRV